MGWGCGQITGLGSEALRLIHAPGLWLATCLLLVMIGGSWALLRFTRLGRAHLLTKCGVLSLLAHGLFAIYAWRTYFAEQGGGGSGGSALQVRLVEQPDGLWEERPLPAELPSWEQFSETSEMPDLDPLARPLLEPELQLERVFPPAAELAMAMSDPRPREPLPGISKPELVVPDLLPVGSDKPAAVTEVAELLEPDRGPGGVAAGPEESDADRGQAQLATPAAPQELTEPEYIPSAKSAASELRAESSADPETESQPAEAQASAAAGRNASQLAGPPNSQLLQLPAPPNGAATTFDLSPKPDQPESQRSELVPLNPQISGRVPIRAASAVLPQGSPAEYSDRTPDRRAAATAARGGSEQTEQAVERGLAWLASQQRSDGRWDPRVTGGGVERLELGQDRRGAGLRADSGISGLALLAFLGAGHTPQRGEYQAVVARGLDYLVRNQTADGFLGGQAANFERTYCHGMALLAVSEALAMTGDEHLRQAVRRGVAYTVNSQSRQDGGWRYQPGEGGDMSQFGWQVLALRTAELGGVATPQATRERMRGFLEGSTRGPFGGLGCYRPGEGASPTMTAEALLCRQLLEQQVDPRTTDEASSYLLQSLPSPSAVNEYYWYYGTLALYHSGGRAWELWNERMTAVLLQRQVQTGPDAGAWPADGMWSGYGGRVFSTALSTLCLEVYYRYAPLYERR